MAAPSHLRLNLRSRPENVLVVRQALTGLAQALRLDAVETNDLNTAVTEAANNVVMHAYGATGATDATDADGATGATGANGVEGYDGDDTGVYGEDEGPLEVTASVGDEALVVVVRDRGVGIENRRRALAESGVESPGAGMGLAVIDALANTVAFTEPTDGGTEVRMEFPPARPGVELEPIEARTEAAGDSLASTAESTGVELVVGPSSLARAVLPRVLSALAARAHFTTDRIRDVQLIAEALAANTRESLDGSQLAICATVSPRTLQLRIGPLRRGRGESLMASAFDGMSPVVERIADATRVADAGADSAEALELDLVDRR
jgi:anti-sigma regulatory factor (Ser/Thr protein kinase)